MGRIFDGRRCGVTAHPTCGWLAAAALAVAALFIPASGALAAGPMQATDGSAIPSPAPTVEPETTVAPDPADGAEPDFGGDLDPHDELSGPRGVCGCESPSEEPALEAAVLAILSDPVTTPPPTDAVIAATASDGSTSGLPLALLGVSVVSLAALATTLRRLAADRA